MFFGQKALVESSHGHTRTAEPNGEHMKKSKKVVRRFSTKGPVVTEEMFDELPRFEDISSISIDEVTIPVRLVYGKSEWFIIARVDDDTVFGCAGLEGDECGFCWGYYSVTNLVRFNGVVYGKYVILPGIIEVAFEDEVRTRNKVDGCRIDERWKPVTVASVPRIQRHNRQLIEYAKSNAIPF